MAREKVFSKPDFMSLESGGADLVPSDWPHYLDMRNIPPSEVYDGHDSNRKRK